MDDRRDAVIGLDLEELRLELVAGADIDRDHLVGNAECLERDMHLVPIGGRPSPYFDHRRSLPLDALFRHPGAGRILRARAGWRNSGVFGAMVGYWSPNLTNPPDR